MTPRAYVLLVLKDRRAEAKDDHAPDPHKAQAK